MPDPFASDPPLDAASSMNAGPDPAIQAACATVHELASRTRAEGPWASGAFAALALHGVLARFVPAENGGMGHDEASLLTALVAVARACLTTALALSQWASGVRLLTACDASVRGSLLPDLATGRHFTTVGISQVTTSRRHLASAPVVASRSQPGTDATQWRIDGACPWVTGADAVDTIVTAAAVTPAAHTDACGVSSTDSTAFFVVERASSGVHVDPPMTMLALSGSRTSRVRFEGVRPLAAIASERVAAPRAGGLATTALALGAARGSVDILARLAVEPPGRSDVARVAKELAIEGDELFDTLVDGSAGDQQARESLRSAANGLANRAATAALVAAKGAGFLEGHPAGRACLESLFFQVWSCPQPLASRAMCALAGLDP